MAWNRNYNNAQPAPVPGADQAMAVDWEVKRIPGFCYKASMSVKESLLLARGGLAHATQNLIRFNAAVESFYTSIDTEFNKYLCSELYLKDDKLPRKRNGQKYEVKDFVGLSYFISATEPDDKFFDTNNMFTIMRWWCFSKGPFRVYNDVEAEDEDVFQRLERELQ